MENIIELFVMQGCHVCPQMERTFLALQQKGEISQLRIFDVAEHPELAQRYQVRSVPHYMINGIAFSGLKSQGEILELLQSASDKHMQVWISDQLTDGQLDEVENKVLQQAEMRSALLSLLENNDTPLVVRIGITAIIETLAQRGVFNDLQARFIKLVDHQEQRIAIDALYYLHLLSTPASLDKLTQVAESGHGELQDQAKELLMESSADAVLH
jgi:predicted thioredoxin/glutaredoxin